MIPAWDRVQYLCAPTALAADAAPARAGDRDVCRDCEHWAGYASCRRLCNADWAWLWHAQSYDAVPHYQSCTPEPPPTSSSLWCVHVARVLPVRCQRQASMDTASVDQRRAQRRRQMQRRSWDQQHPCYSTGCSQTCDPRRERVCQTRSQSRIWNRSNPCWDRRTWCLLTVLVTWYGIQERFVVFVGKVCTNLELT